MSFNEFLGIGAQHSANANLYMLLRGQDDAASATITDDQGNTSWELSSGNTSDVSVTGPNNWLPKALNLTASAYARATVSGKAITAAAHWLWVRTTVTSGTATVWAADQTGTDWTAIVARAADFRGDVDDDSDGGRLDVLTDVSDPTDGTWHFVGLTWTAQGTLRIFTDGAFSSDTQSLAAQGTSITPGDNWAWGGGDHSAFNAGDIDSALLGFADVELSEAEFDEIYDGPELVYSSGVDFQDDGTFDIGTWSLPSPFASGSNGSQTQEVIAVNAAGSVLDTATTATGTLDLSSEAGNTCYLLARVSNTGGYDIGDKATRTSSYGSANDGYYEIASVTAADDGVSAADAFLVTDTVSAVVRVSGAIADGLSLTDAAGVAVLITESISDSLVVSDATTSFATVAETVSDSLILTDETTGTEADSAETLPDSLVLTDAAAGTVQNLTESLGESLQVVDTLTAFATTSQALSESLVLSDTLSDVVRITETLADGLSLTDAVTVSVRVPLVLLESVVFGDTLTPTFTVTAAATDSILFNSQTFVGAAVVSSQIIDLIGTSQQIIDTQGTSEQILDVLGSDP